MGAGDLFAIVEPAVDLHPSAPAIVTIDGQVLTYAKLAQTVAAFASHVRQENIGTGDRVAIDIPNETVRLCLIFALSRIGAIAVPSGTPDEIIGAGVGLTAVISYRVEYRATPRVIAFHQGWFSPIETPSSPASHSRLTEEDPTCLVMASSGSTGRKKFMEFRQGMLQRRLDWDDGMLLHNGANRLMTLSIATDFGFRNALRTLRHGGVLVGPASSPQATIELLDLHDIGELVTTPSILIDLIEEMRHRPRQLPGYRSIITVGGPIAGFYAAEAARLFHSTVTNVYGSTEIGIIGVATGEEWFANAGASGSISPWLRLEIIDDEGKLLPPGGEGQVRVKLDSAFTVLGYMNGGEVDEEPIRDGWFYPGDLGQVSEAGQLSISGRARELINTGGNKISPAAIEERLSHIRGISRVAAVGIRNESGFDSVGIAICRRPEEPISEIRKAVSRRLNLASDPRIIEVDQLPLNDSGKIDRARLRSLFG